MAASYNELFGLGSHSPDANLEGWWPLQDNAASTTVVDYSGNSADGTLQGGSNTADVTTEGPNSWLTAAIDFAGASHVDVPLSAVGTNAFTALARINSPSTSGTELVFASNAINGNNFWLGRSDARASFSVNGITVYQSGIASNTWCNIAGRRNGSSQTVTLDGTTASSTSSTVANSVSSAEHAIGVFGSSDSFPFSGDICDVSRFSRELTLAEVAQWEAGPELINSVAPSISGTERVDETLTCTSGIWGLDSPFASGSNGTATYSYQWTRSDDETGTNEADIAGATSSTYTIQADDSGKYLRCRVRASNDGGFDAAADTNSNFTAQVASGFNAAWARRHTQLIGGGCL